MCKRRKRLTAKIKRLEDLLASKTTEPIPPPVPVELNSTRREDPMFYSDECVYSLSGNVKAVPYTSVPSQTPNVSVNLTAETSPTETDKQRSYLIKRLEELRPNWYNGYDFLRKMFNMDVNNSPKNFRELIDVIKNDKFTIDAKIAKEVDEEIADGLSDEFPDFGMTWGIIWNGVQPDPDGYQKAVNEYKAAYESTKDTIMVSSPADGLAALNAFKAFKPSNAPTT